MKIILLKIFQSIWLNTWISRVSNDLMTFRIKSVDNQNRHIRSNWFSFISIVRSDQREINKQNFIYQPPKVMPFNLPNKKKWIKNKLCNLRWYINHKIKTLVWRVCFSLINLSISRDKVSSSGLFFSLEIHIGKSKMYIVQHDDLKRIKTYHVAMNSI